jgi:hypothetical protein
MDEPVACPAMLGQNPILFRKDHEGFGFVEGRTRLGGGSQGRRENGFGGKGSSGAGVTHAKCIAVLRNIPNSFGTPKVRQPSTHQHISGPVR